VPALCALLLPPSAFAGGFNIYEMSTRATALGGAFTATADDASAVFYNPAGLAWQPGTWSVSLSTSPILPATEFTRANGLTADAYPGDQSSQTADNVFFPTGLYAGYRLSPSWVLGLGFFTPFGLGVEWDDPDTFSGRTLSTNSNIRGYYVSPMATWQPRPSFALSAGFHVVISELDLSRIQTQRFGTDGADYNVVEVDISGTSDVALGPALGAMFRPGDAWSFGVNYKGGVDNDFSDGEAVFTQIPTGIMALDDGVAANLTALGTTQDLSGSLPYPSMVAAGVRYDGNGWAIMGDFVWFSWSDFDEVTLDFESTAIEDQVLEEYYQDGQQWRFGFSAQLTPSLEGLLGFVVDNNPQPSGSVSPLLPDADRLDYSLGLSWRTGRLAVNAAYMLVDFEERSTVVDGVGMNFEGFDGTYDSVANIFSFGVNLDL
jgi:long-chain fatty acid transport protein